MSAEARTLRLLDLPLLAMHSQRVHPNQAVTLGSLASAREAGPSWSDLLLNGLRLGALHVNFLGLNKGRAIWVSREGSTLLGMAGLRRRSGRVVWEIDQLLTTTPNEAFLLDLLDRVVATAGADGAHRLFLRLRADSNALQPALQHGFSVVMEETLFEGAPPSVVSEQDTRDSGGAHARRRRRGDDQALFQLHLQAVNQEVRWLTALSPREWRAALDPLGRGGEEWVLPGKDNVGIDALVRIAPGRKMSCATVLSTNLDSARDGVALALRKGGEKHGRVRLLAGTGDVSIAAERAGLAPSGQFQLLVRPIAQRAHRLQLAEQAVEGSARHVIQ